MSIHAWSRSGAAALLVAVACVASCGGGSGRATTRSTATTTVSTTTPPTSGGTVPTATCSTPTQAAQTVVAAWMAADRATASRCATPDAVATLFAQPGRSARWTFQACDGPDPGVPVCSFAYPSGTARLTLHGTEAAGWSVDRVELSPA